MSGTSGCWALSCVLGSMPKLRQWTATPMKPPHWNSQRSCNMHCKRKHGQIKSAQILPSNSGSLCCRLRHQPQATFQRHAAVAVAFMALRGTAGTLWNAANQSIPRLRVQSTARKCGLQHTSPCFLPFRALQLNVSTLAVACGLELRHLSRSVNLK